MWAWFLILNPFIICGLMYTFVVFSEKFAKEGTPLFVNKTFTKKHFVLQTLFVAIVYLTPFIYTSSSYSYKFMFTFMSGFSMWQLVTTIKMHRNYDSEIGAYHVK